MRLNALQVENCRNITKARLYPASGLTVIAGDNGQGKTNLLECIFLLTGGKSFRAGKDAEMVRRGKRCGNILGDCFCGGREQAIEIAIEAAEGGRRGRFAKVNGVDYGRAGAIAGTFTAVVFEPGHLRLVKDGPEGRRRFLDAALCQLYPGYLSILRRYHRALAQKNVLLRRYHETTDADGQLDVFDAELTQSGGEISRRRAAYLEQTGPAAERYYAELSRRAETLTVRFEPCAGEGGLAAKLAARRGADVRAGFSTCGPHREDFDVLLSGNSARVFGSQGQQRSAVLSLKLAEAELAETVSGEAPVLLLDDVLSELDEGRQAYLLGKIHGRQSFVTCCDAAAFERANGKVVHIRDGSVLN